MGMVGRPRRCPLVCLMESTRKEAVSGDTPSRTGKPLHRIFKDSVETTIRSTQVPYFGLTLNYFLKMDLYIQFRYSFGADLIDFPHLVQRVGELNIQLPLLIPRRRRLPPVPRHFLPCRRLPPGDFAVPAISSCVVAPSPCPAPFPPLVNLALGGRRHVVALLRRPTSLPASLACLPDPARLPPASILLC